MLRYRSTARRAGLPEPKVTVVEPHRGAAALSRAATGLARGRFAAVAFAALSFAALSFVALPAVAAATDSSVPGPAISVPAHSDAVATGSATSGSNAPAAVVPGPGVPLPEGSGSASPAVSPPGDAAAGSIAFTPFDDKVFTQAERSGAPFVLYFTADWCQPCREMHERTFRAPAVLEAAAGTRFLRVDMTKPDRYVRLVKKSFRVLGAPTVIVFGKDGKEKARRFGFIPPEDFARMLGEGARGGGST